MTALRSVEALLEPIRRAVQHEVRVGVMMHASRVDPRQRPWDQDAETTLTGGALLGWLSTETLATLEPSDFYAAATAVVYGIARDRRLAGADRVTDREIVNVVAERGLYVPDLDTELRNFRTGQLVLCDAASLVDRVQRAARQRRALEHIEHVDVLLRTKSLQADDIEAAIDIMRKAALALRGRTA